ncbi:MAG: CRISPR-associated protein Cas4 [Synergistaceae bacterium]|jgi:CRISPR-associated exonuclease Cas4|nr:CRISPR-associated protein Cas4 [Synergistaceae bacterium]
MFSDDDLLSISGLQHLMFCERQWSLIHMEQEWSDNVLTVEGRQIHEYVHEPGSGSRSGVVMLRSLSLRSSELGLYGVADMVEFHRCDDGAEIVGHSGRWMPYPVEYKRGGKRCGRPDEVQVCAQALCLEEMFGLHIAFGAVYYDKPRRRVDVEISEALRKELKALCARARQLYDFADRPTPNIGKHCKNCSLVGECMPDVIAKDRSAAYMSGILRDISASLEY